MSAAHGQGLPDPQTRGGKPIIRRVERGRLRRARQWHRGRPHYEVRRRPRGDAVALDAGLRSPRRSHAHLRLRADARGSDGGVREELAAAVKKSPERAGAFRWVNAVIWRKNELTPRRPDTIPRHKSGKAPIAGRIDCTCR